MNGQAFRVRHKEWNIECAKLAFKTLPWLLLLMIPILLASNFIDSIIIQPPIGASNATQLFCALPVLAFFVIMFTFLLYGAYPHAAFILIHRIDQGMKKDPITAAWYVFHDKNMWKDHFASMKRYVAPMIMMILALLVFAVISSFMFPTQATPSISSENKQALEAASAAFYSEHPGVKLLKCFADGFFILIFSYFGIREMFIKARFSSFLQANSYKNFEQCQAEAHKAKSELLILELIYVAAPIGILCVLSMVLPTQYTMIALVQSVAGALTMVYIQHMNYLIGRDYYIGPPAKKIKETKSSGIFSAA